MHRRDPLAALTERFDPLGPTVHRSTVSTGRTVRFIDEGEADWLPLLWFGGAGTSVRAFRLLEFARPLREHLRIRVVSVERNGLGETPFDEASGPAEHAADVWALLDERGISSVSLMAISGGGPYAAHVAAAAPSRVRSLHLACAYAERLPGAALPSIESIAADPPAWWSYPDSSPVHRIPGFIASVTEEAALSRFSRHGDVPPAGLVHAFSVYADSPLPELTGVSAPAFLYWGADDQLVSTAHLERWRAALPNVHEVRLYDGEGHDVQYRHWDQVLADVAFLGDRIVVSHRGRTQLVDPGRARELIAAGGALGLAAWQAASRTSGEHAARR